MNQKEIDKAFQELALKFYNMGREHERKSIEIGMGPGHAFYFNKIDEMEKEYQRKVEEEEDELI